MIAWHRLFGLILTDFFLDSAYTVELEKDLSLKQQLLDVVIIEKEKGKAPDPLPDGLEDLGPHNLMTYKSHQESLDGWTIEELCGHYVNYRKQISPSLDKLLPSGDFRLYGVSTRYPENLAGRIRFQEIKEGVYDIRWGIRNIRIIVLNRIPKTERNAPWLMFSAVRDKIEYGATHYRLNSPVSTIINTLFDQYEQEGIAMAYTMEDFHREIKEQVLKSLTPEERLRGLKAEEILKLLKQEEIEAYLKNMKG